MLFDLRSRGRRRTVQGVYLGLAILMGGGLVLFGVGAGNGLGGLLNAFNNSGSSSGQTQAVSQQEKAAITATQTAPNNPAAWSQLLQARWTTAGQGGDYNANTSTFTAAGKNELNLAAQDWQRYLQLTKNPDPDVAILAAHVYEGLENYSGEAQAWQVYSASNPNVAKGYECLAASAYAANQTRVGDLATGKALSLVPKAQQTLLKNQLNQAKTNPSIALSC
jgi:hypothetical protein